MIVIPASLRSDFIHMAGMTIHIALESTIHIVGIRSESAVCSPFSLRIQTSAFPRGLAFSRFLEFQSRLA
jgi:hypothetical protein